MPGGPGGRAQLLEGSIRAAYERLGAAEKADAAIAAAYAEDLREAAWILANAVDWPCDLFDVLSDRVELLEAALSTGGLEVPAEEVPWRTMLSRFPFGDDL